MIELIFAIVVISFVVLAVPTLMQTSSKNVENALAQEAIFIASAELIGASSAYWDENSMNDANQSSLSRIIDVDNDCDSTTHLRPGNIHQPFHRRCLDDNSIDPKNAAGGDDYDLDDMEHDSQAITTALSNSSGYKKDYNSTLDVTPSTTNSNIKILTETILDAQSGTTLTTLKLEVFNLGEAKPYKKRML